MIKIKLKMGPFVVDMKARFLPRDWPHPYCSPFQYEGPEPPDLTLRIHSDLPPLSQDDNLIAEFVNQWRLYACGKGGYYLEILDQGHFQPRQAAFIHPNWNQIELHWLPSPPSVRSSKLEWRLGPVMEPLIQWWLIFQLGVQAKGMILHGSAVVVDHQGFAFIGPSEAGKTTIARLCRMEAKATILNDETILLWHDGLKWQVTGTPWHGSARIVSPLAAPLSGVYFLKKAPQNQWMPLDPDESVIRLVSEAFLPIWSTEAMNGLWSSMERLILEVPTGELHFRKDPSIVDYLRTGLKERATVQS